jgi:uncharacterized membrane protein
LFLFLSKVLRAHSTYFTWKGGETMIGGIVFVIAFVLFLLISFVMPLPPGAMVVEEYIPDLIGTTYEGAVSGIINGVIYGVIIWIIFSVAKMLYDRMQGPKETVVKIETKD